MKNSSATRPTYYLPNELWLKIFTDLSHQDLKQVRLVSKHWNTLAYESKLLNKSKIIINPYNLRIISERLLHDASVSNRFRYSTVHLYSIQMQNPLVFILKHLGCNIQSLIIEKSPILVQLNEYLPNLEKLQIKETSLLNCNAKGLVNFTKLQILSVELNNTTENFVLDLLQNLSKNLCELEIVAKSKPFKIMKWKQKFEAFNCLKVLKINGTCSYGWLKAILESLSITNNLQHLDLYGCLEMKNDLLELILDKWSHSLKEMDVSFCYNLTDNSVKQLHLAKDNLRNLSMAYCRNITCKGLLQGIAQNTNFVLRTLNLNEMPHIDAHLICALCERLPHLTALHLENCPAAITNASLSHISRHLVNLQHLFLDGSIKVTHKGFIGDGNNTSFSNLKQLQTLSMVGCTRITDDSLLKAFLFPKLRTLRMGYNNNITTIGIKGLISNCPILEELVICSCCRLNDESIFFIATQLSELRILNISNCFNLTERCIDYIVEWCKRLQQLHFSGMKSWSLKAVRNKLLKKKPHVVITC